MKSLLAIILIMATCNVVSAQDPNEQKAIAEANKMTAAYNQRDFSKYVDYMLPSQYDNDTANKKGFAELFSRNTDTSKLELLKLLKFKIVNHEQQALFLHRFHQRNGYIIGVSDNNGEQWHFSQALSQEVHFELVLRMAPSLDTSFALLIDPKFGKRIDFRENEMIPSFHFTDIKGKVLSSDDLAGKIIVLNFWSITCGPCIKEMPQLNELVEKMKGKNVVFVALAFYSPKEYIIDKFLPKHPFDYNIVEVTNPDDYSVFEFPTHIVTDKSHNIIYKASDGNPENVKKLTEVVQSALNK